MIDYDRILKPPHPDNLGMFMLLKSMFKVQGVNVPRQTTGRCQNINYAPSGVVYGTPYEDEQMPIDRPCPYSGIRFKNEYNTRHYDVIDASPFFYIIYVEYGYKDVNSHIPIPAMDIYNCASPSTLWAGKSFIELFKNIREWSFMGEEPFNSDHPMAKYSKIAWDYLNIPQNLVDEIDNLPDMHLARFLKGDENHRSVLENFPQMSDEFKNWLVPIIESHRPKTLAERIAEL